MYPMPKSHWRWGVATGGGVSTGHAATLFDAAVTWFGKFKTIGGKLWVQDKGLLQLDGSPSDAETSFSCTFETVSGIGGSLAFSGAAPLGPGGLIEIFGDKGVITIRQPMIVPTPGDRVFAARMPDARELSELPIPEEFRISMPGSAAATPTYESFFPLAAAFKSGIETDSSPSPNFEDSCHLQRICEALRQSSDEGRFISI
jgi:predicted dehydrogenase